MPTFLYGSENWTLTALQRRRIEAAEMKLLRPVAGYTLYDHKTNDSVRRELQTECILDKIDEYRRNWLLHLQRMQPNRIPLKSYHYRPQGRRTIGRPKKRWREQFKSGDGTDQRIQSLMFMMMMMMMMMFYVLFVLCRSLYCLCVYVYCTTVTGWLPIAVKYIISYISYQFLSCPHSAPIRRSPLILRSCFDLSGRTAKPMDRRSSGKLRSVVVIL